MPLAAPRSRTLIASSAASSAGDGVEAEGKPGMQSWLIRHRSILLLVALVVHKSLTDSLTRWTRLQTAYSGSTVALMSEVVKFPLIAFAIASFGGGARLVLPTFVQAFQKTPFANAWIALCYTFNNLLYFDALSALSAVAYQTLSQSKTIFTAALMYFIVGKKMLIRQVAAVGMLVVGALLVQLQELAGTAAAGPSAATSLVLWGAALTLFSSFISALPNVAYEKVLKTEGESQWVNNVQVTVWIIVWIGGSSLLQIIRSAAAGAPLPVLPHLTAAPAAFMEWLVGAFSGFTPAVWGVVLLKALNGLLIPATFKYADNILYAYAKPSSIVATTLMAAIFAGALPAPSLMAGVALVVGSIVLYSSKPASKSKDA